MFFGRNWRKKRSLLLCRVPATEKKPAMSWVPSTHNVTGRETLWLRSSVFSHNIFCGCGDAVAHFNRIAQRLAGTAGNQPPDTTARPALRALPPPPLPPSPRRHTGTENPQCGGDDRGDGGRGEGGAGGGDDGDLATEDVDELLELLDDPE